MIRNILTVTLCLFALTSVSYAEPEGVYRDVIIEKDISGALSVDNAGFGENLRLRKRLTQDDAFQPLSYDTVAAMMAAMTLPAVIQPELEEALKAVLLSRAEYPPSDDNGYVFEQRLFALQAVGAGDDAATLAAGIPAELADERFIDMRDILLSDASRFDVMCENRTVRAVVARERSDTDGTFLFKEDAARLICALFHDDDKERAGLLASLIAEQHDGDTPSEVNIRKLADVALSSPDDALIIWRQHLQALFANASAPKDGKTDLFDGRSPETVADELFSEKDILKTKRRAALADIWVAYFAVRKAPLPFTLAQALIRSDHAGAGLLTLFYQLHTQGGTSRIDSGLKKDAARLLNTSGLTPAAKALHALYGQNFN